MESMFRNIRLESLRTRICYLMQEAILFDRTLKENLLLGKPSATHKELQRAVEIADLGEVVRRLPNGWDTPLGPRGNALSGGNDSALPWLVQWFNAPPCCCSMNPHRRWTLLRNKEF